MLTLKEEEDKEEAKMSLSLFKASCTQPAPNQCS
jgi:hypothetical protein